ncbi:MAG: hypothetical protein L3J43_04335, partial [Sulfurovum sp.]|nr:hypothetical protein [Sulfurovum sp.]
RADDDKFNWIIADYNWSFDYATAINITEYVQQGGRYWVADLKATETSNQGSGWGIAVIVEDTTSQIRTLKNISLYNGYIGVFDDVGYTKSITSSISGFFTPRSGPVKSNLIVMSAESDRALSDSMSVTKKDGTPVDIVDSLNNKNNVQNATISRNGKNVTSRNPNYENTLGIDIDEIDVSHIIDNSQTSTDITVTSGNDYIFLNMYGFATELYMPKFCYDYNIQKNNFSLTADEGRNFTINGTGELKAHVSVRSKEGDFDLENSKLKFYLTPSGNFSFTNAQYSPNTVNSLIPAITTTQHTALKPEIAIGEGASSDGGTIGIYERYFAQYNYKILKNETIDVHFAMELNTSIDFGSGPVEFLLSSENNTLPRCEQNLTYNPLLGAFNIERTDSGTYDPVTQPQRRFPLFTQVANKPFDVSIVSYDVNASPKYMNELLLPSDMVVDVELIDSSPYNDEKSFFKCQNTQEDIIQTLGNGEKSHLVNLNQNTSRTDISDIFQTPNALWNAAFRLWYFEDTNGSFIPHACDTKTDGKCWREKVYNILQPSLTTNFCDSLCSSTNDTTDSCYQCLRKFYAKPVCSRDNFAIKPASFRMKLFDNNESNQISFTETELVVNDTTMSTIGLSAEYQYKVDVKATQYGNDQEALGFTTLFSTPSSNDKQSIVLFNSNTGTCADTNNTDWGLWFENGKAIQTMNGTKINLQSNMLVNIPNVGNYTYHIEDNNWTIVDQARYVDKDGNSLKTFPDVDDCITSGEDKYSIAASNIGKSGCGITSQLTYTPANASALTYQDIPLQVNPYTFDLAQVNATRRPNRNILFMNDLSNDYYGSVLSASISMATSFEGNVTAMGKQGTRLTNFTDGCAASDVMLDLSRTMLPQESDLENVPFQQYLEVGVNVVDTQEGLDKQVLLPKGAFSNSDIGSASMQLHTTLKKPLGFGNAVNPVRVQYNALKATSPAAASNTHMINNYVPEGNNTYDNNITYVYAKVTPLQRLYEVEPSFIQTPLYVDVYCDDLTPPLASNDCANLFGLDTPSRGKQEKEPDWHLATIFANNELGTTDITVSHFAEANANPFVSVDAGVKAKTVSDVPFNDNQATQNDINVSVAGSERNSMIKVGYNPVPWLIYDPLDDYFKVHFIGPSTWAGVGKTGHVTDTGSSSTQNDRMTW